jgi:hypothetical protein
MGAQFAQSQLIGMFDMNDRFSGISLWLMPPQKERSALRKVIDRVAEEQHSDAFEPHITLASLSPGTSTEGWTDAIAAQLQKHVPILATFDKLRTGNTFFQSVFADIQQDKKLFAFREDIVASITQGRAPDPKLGPDWYPHISFFYGSPPQTEKGDIVKTLEETGDEETGRVAKIKQFEANEVWIVQTDGHVKEWRILGIVTTPGAMKL